MTTAQLRPARASATPRPMPRPAPVISATRLSIMTQCLAKCVQEEIFTPHDALVHAQSFLLVVCPVLENTLPTRCIDGEEFRRGQGIHNTKRPGAVEMRARWIAGQLCQAKQATCGDS